MMRREIVGAIAGLLILFVALAFAVLTSQTNPGNTSPGAGLLATPGPASSAIPVASVRPNDTMEVPLNDIVINRINWSSYPNLQTGYVYSAYVSGPTSAIPHEFMEIQILTEVKGTDNKTAIREQLAGVAREARGIYGPDSSINIHGTREGASAWLVSMRPYDDTIY